MSNIDKLIFWRKASNYSAFVCAIALALNLIFKKYAIEYRLDVLIFGIVLILFFLISQFMQLILKNKINKN